MEFIKRTILYPFVTFTVFIPQMRKLNGGAPLSSFSCSMAAAAFDVNLLSNILTSFVENYGDKDGFDLVICIQNYKIPGYFDEFLLPYLNKHSFVIDSCSDILPQLAQDYNQVVYLMLPENKTFVGDTFRQISRVYHVVKTTFYSSPRRTGTLSWMPMFVVVWPELTDHCQSDSSSERLIRAWINKEESEENKEKISFLVNSDVYVYLGSECDSFLHIWEVFSLQGLITVQKLHRNLPSNKAIVAGREPLFQTILGRVGRRLDLRQTTVRAISSRDPSSFLEAPGAGHFDSLQIVNGTPWIVFHELLQILNFTAKIFNGDWIRSYPNGSLRGVTVNLFRKGMVDITISFTSLLPYRKVELAYLQPTYSNSINGFFVQPAASTLRDIVIAPFSFQLWASLFFTYLILLSSIIFFERQYRKISSDEDLLVKGDYELGNELTLWAVGALAQQGWHTYPKSNSVRMAFTLGYFLGLLSYCYFSGSVVSILAAELIPIKSRVDLLSSSLTFYADNASSTLAYIVDYLQQNTGITFGNKVNIEEGISRLKGDKPSCYIAFPNYFYLSAQAINISQNWICDHLSVIPVTTTGTPSSMVVPRDSKYAEIFNFMILKMFSSGVNRRFVNLYNDVTTWKCTGKGNTFSPLGINDVFTAVFILFAGFISSILFLCIESIWKRLLFRVTMN